jgi:hypothetical protein
MIILKVVQFLIFFSLLTLAISQIVIPLVKNTKMFPILSSRRSKIQAALVKANEERELHELQERVRTVETTTTPQKFNS